ncbi:MAG: LPS assembly lipoprotein LptE [Ignavibacteriota bacterium]
MTLLNKKNKIFLIAILNLLFVALTSINFTSCCAYSFTGASVPEHLKTIAIPIADDRSGSGEPGLRENLTQKLIQKFIDDNTLQVSERTSANALLESSIVSLSDAPAIVSAGESITSRRVTIGVRVIYRDLVKRTTVFEKTFSNYSDYLSSNPIEGRKTAIEEALDRISDDILLDTVSGW